MSARGLLAALRGDYQEAKTHLTGQGEDSAGTIEYIDAWNRLFRGWALRLCGRFDESKAELKHAQAFFSGVQVPSGEIHAALELAACEIEERNNAGAEKRLHALRSRFT